MEFAFTDEQEMIRDTAAAFLAEASGSSAVRAAMATESGYDPDLWQRVCQELYWPAIHIPEEYGGMGLGYVELVATLEQMGRHLFCSPFFSTVCLGVNALLVAANEAQKAQYLPQIVAGTTATLACTGPGGRWDAGGIEAEWERDGDGYRISGSYRFVPDGHSARLLIVAARAPGSRGEEGISLFALPAETAGLSREWLPTMDQTRKQAQLQFDRVRVGADAVLGEPGAAWPQLAKVIDLAAVGVAADQLGGSQQVLDMTVAYLQERVQFGRVIASYQAVKHKCADMMAKRTEVARSGRVLRGLRWPRRLCSAARSADELPEAASVAKSYCSAMPIFAVAGDRPAVARRRRALPGNTMCTST